jgi:serine/threonine protein phosphatase PrpC
MQIQIRVFSAPKAGNEPEEYEDAYAFDEMTGRVAVADGASDAFESGKWARALTEAFVKSPPLADTDSMLEWLSLPIGTWRSGIHWEELAWYSEEKASRGSFATLLGVSFEESAETPQRCSWSALAVGDSCLFHIRHNALLTTFPLSNPDEFGNTPFLLSTRSEYSKRSLQAITVASGEWQPDDLIVLSTDAFSAWLLLKKSNDTFFWSSLPSLSSDLFFSLVQEARSTREMKNDDVTLVVARASRPPFQQACATNRHE